MKIDLEYIARQAGFESVAEREHLMGYCTSKDILFDDDFRGWFYDDGTKTGLMEIISKICMNELSK